MNSKLLRVLSIAIIGAPAAVYAQTTTLDYQGNVGDVGPSEFAIHRDLYGVDYADRLSRGE
jgi:hypothetical protein